MGITAKQTTAKLIYNIINKMKEQSPSLANTYHRLSGYTRGADGVHTVVMIEQADAGKGVLVNLVSPTKISTSKNDIGHANDCTYYNGTYYVAKGGGKPGNSNVIKRYDNNLNHITPDYTCPSMSNVTCIAHVSSDYFFLGEDKQLILCQLDTKSNTFVKKGGLELPEKGTIVEGWTHQGMCFYNTFLYKLYSKKVGDQYLKNYIAVYKIDGVLPNFTKITLSSVYECNPTEENLYQFEAEAINVNSEGIFVAIDKRTSSVGYSAEIRKITVKN